MASDGQSLESVSSSLKNPLNSKINITISPEDASLLQAYNSSDAQGSMRNSS